jgi:putative copper export protein
MDNFLFLPRAGVAALFNIAFSCATGLVLLACLLRGLQSRIRRMLPICWAAILVSLLLQLWLTAATMTGSTQLSTLRAAWGDVFTRTHAGLMVVCCTVVAVLGFAWSVSVFGRTWRVGSAATLVLLAAFRSASGHAAVNGSLSTAEFVQFLHLISTAVWSGCIITSSIFIFQNKIGDPAQVVLFMRRVSQVATISVVLVFLTGLYNSYRSVGTSLTLLDHSRWGAFLISKVTLVCFALGVGAYGRSVVHSPVEISEAKLSSLTAALCIEAFFMLLILGLSAFLANSPAPIQP